MAKDEFRLFFNRIKQYPQNPLIVIKVKPCPTKGIDKNKINKYQK